MEKVVSRVPSDVVSSVSTSQSDRAVLFLGEVFAWLMSTAQSDHPELFEWSCVHRVLMSQSNPPALLSCFLFFLDMAFQGYVLVFFLLYQ